MKQTEFPVFDRCTIDEAEQEDFLAMDLRKYIDRHRDMVFPHRHNFYHLVLFTAGKGSFTVDFESFVVEPDTLYFMVPGQVHTWNFETIPDGYIVNFSADFFHSLLLDPDYMRRFSFAGGIAADQVIRMENPFRGKILALLQEMDVYSNSSEMKNLDFVRTMLLHFLFLLDGQATGLSDSRQGKDWSGRPSAANRRALLRDFRGLIEKHFREEKFPKFYADKLHVSPNHLNTVCRTYLGKQAGELIRERIVLEAKRMLINPQTTISSIAYDLNFSDNSYFTKFFKKLEGNTPEEFREKHATGQ